MIRVSQLPVGNGLIRRPWRSVPCLDFSWNHQPLSPSGCLQESQLRVKGTCPWIPNHHQLPCLRCCMEVPKDRTVISWHFHGHLFSIFLGTPCSVSHQSRSKFINHADSGVPISHIDPCPSIYIYNSSNNQNSTEFPHVQPFLRSTWDMKHTIPSHSTGWSMAYVIQEFHPLEVCSVYHVYMIILVLLIHIYIYM